MARSLDRPSFYTRTNDINNRSDVPKTDVGQGRFVSAADEKHFAETLRRAVKAANQGFETRTTLLVLAAHLRRRS